MNQAQQSQVKPVYTLPTLDEVIAEHVAHALGIFGWNMTRAAVALGVDRRTLYRMVERHGVRRPTDAPPPEDDEQSRTVSHATDHV